MGDSDSCSDGNPMASVRLKGLLRLEYSTNYFHEQSMKASTMYMCVFFSRINLRTLGRCIRPAIPQSRGETHHCYHFSFLYLRVNLWLPNLNEDSSIARSRDARGTKERNAGRGQSFRRQQASKFPRNYDASLTQRACRDELGPLDPLTTQFPLPSKRKGK